MKSIKSSNSPSSQQGLLDWLARVILISVVSCSIGIFSLILTHTHPYAGLIWVISLACGLFAMLANLSVLSLGAVAIMLRAYRTCYGGILKSTRHLKRGNDE